MYQISMYAVGIPYPNYYPHYPCPHCDRCPVCGKPYYNWYSNNYNTDQIKKWDCKENWEEKIEKLINEKE